MSSTPPVAADDDATALGRKIRDLRTRAGLTLDDLANAAGVSRSQISQIERGVAGPSLSTLRGIAYAIGVPMAALFLDSGDVGTVAAQPESAFVVRAAKRKKMHARRSRVEYELLTPDVNRQVEFLLGELGPGSSVPPEQGAFVAHEGEENVYVESGSVVFLLGAQELALGPGDSISFDCTVPHRVENRSGQAARMIIAITPPTF